MKDLDEVLQRRSALLGVAAGLESALAAPGSDTRWPERVGSALTLLQETLADHVAATEAPDGTLDQVRTRAPRLVNQIDQLTDEHVSMTTEVERLIDRIDRASVERSTEETTAIREQALELLATIMRHRHRGADLLYEAYDVDVGGPGGA